MAVRRGLLRVAFVGPNMDLAEAAHLSHLTSRGHEVEYYLSPDRLPRAPAPDVVVIAPLTSRNGTIEGPCLLSRRLPGTTLIVTLATAEGPSHSMFFKHALGGRCHSRVLVHYPRPGFSAEEFVIRLDEVARRSGPVAESMCGLPENLDLLGAAQDLGQVMEEDRKMQEFLYVAATDPEWSTWGELALKLGYSEGTVKNRMSQFGKLAIRAGLIPSKTDPTEKYRAGTFVRYVTEHQSFIKAYAEHTQPVTLEGVPGGGERGSGRDQGRTPNDAEAA